jgi:hypothetical protein
MASLSEWNFFNRNVQGGLLEGRFMNAAFTLIAAGPPRLAAAGITAEENDVELGNIAFPIGVIQSFNLGQNTQVMRLFEIGSERSYFIRGRTMGQIGIGRIMYHGPSLLRVLYAYLKSEAGPVQFESLYDNSAQAQLNTSGAEGSKDQYELPPGYENLWIDLASDVFSQPIGLLVMMRDSNADTVGAFYLEYCHITNHGMATDAGGTILTENAAILYERVLPIDVRAVALIKDSTSVQSIVGSNVIGSAA